MRFVVYGAGAIGGVVGARLFESGHEVVLLARGAHRDEIRAHGLRIDSVDASRTLPVPVAGHPDEITIGDDDVVLLGMKSQDTPGALASLIECAPRDTAIVSLQNGVANERAALRLFPNVYGVCVMCPAGHLEPGVVEAYSSPVTGLLDIGRYPSGLDATAEAVAAAFRASTFESEPRADIMRWKYQKLLMNLGNAIEAACGPDGRLSDLARAARREAIACYDAAGITYASRDEDRERRGDLLRIHDVGGRARGGGSSWQSLARATGTIETDYLNGEIVLLGRLYGVPTPVNDLLQRVARELAASAAPPASMTVDELVNLASGAVPG